MVDRLSWQAATAAQESVWFAQQLRPDDVAPDTSALHAHVPGARDTAVLAAGGRRLGAESEAVRTRFAGTDGGLVRSVVADVPATLAVIDLRDENDPAETALTWMR